METKKAVYIGLLAAAVSLPAFSQELPKPTYANSVIVSLEHSVQDSTEVDYIKTNLPFGLYAWPSFSLTVVPVAMDWHTAAGDAANGIQAFKDQVDVLIAAAKAKNVRIHIVVVSGLARAVEYYREAKEEDIRNAQWYNDNKLAADSQITQADAMTKYVFGTFSRYARKLRSNLEAKGRAAASFLKQRMDENPDIIAAVSGWGEPELNYLRINNLQNLQDYFCDFSPFAVLEFRDWIQHAGLYDDAAGLYPGQGYASGGAKYQGTAGLAQFNADFGAAFATWDLRYFNWSLADDWDQIPGDYVNADPNRIRFSSYLHGGMMPASGASYIAGGFDPPRTMVLGNAFWDLWNYFRETMVNRFVGDMASWVRAAGIPADRWYTHQIPADYLFGTNPSMVQKNPRYYSSASPLWTARVGTKASVGATIYDVKFPPEIFAGEFIRTTEYILPDISSLSADWAILEYDAEAYPAGYTVAQSAANMILEQYLRIYGYRPHFINFWRWIDAEGRHQIKGMNKEVALREFIRRIRDKARSTDLTVVYAPPKVIGLSGSYQPAGTSLSATVSTATTANSAAGMQLQITGKIWDGEAWNWKDWGDFSRFRVYRSTTPNFSADAAHQIGVTTGYTYTDAAVVFGSTYYYKWQAENVSGVLGPTSDEFMVLTAGVDISGRVTLSGAGLGGATILFSNGGGTATTAADGTYTKAVGLGWSGTASASKVGYRFEPASRAYISVAANQTGQDYQATAASVFISGTIATSGGTAVDGVTITFSDGGGTASTDAAGAYSKEIGYDWSGTATPAKDGYMFTPVSRSYSSVASNQTDQNFTAQLGPPPQLAVSPASLNFASANGFSTAPQAFRVSNAGGGYLNWSVSDDAAWLTCAPLTGINSALVTVTANPAGLAAGTYAATITVSSTNSTNGPLTVAVSLQVKDGSESPFGYFETPLDGTTNIEGSVPVTGWALDDIEVVSVKIWRDPVAGEPVHPNGYVFIGDAVFVTGARPDVAQIFATYPFNNRAGWGYMLLTNFLPNSGNGTFVLHAVAADREGRTTLIGSRTITCDNAHAVLPFGAIDTPAQGGTANGTSFVNYAWVLTPLSNYIPYDGTTLWVYVDGAPLGHPDYGYFRADIATLFPGYLNANAAIGYRRFDTTAYADGTHTIVWGVRDSAGNESGIGSRYFEIQNITPAGAEAIVAAAASPMALTEEAGGRLAVEVVGLPEIEVEELERVVVKFRAGTGVRIVGWSDGPGGELPIGSTLDAAKGIFYWSPGPGFLGRYVLHFAATDGSARSAPVDVAVTIVPKKFRAERRKAGD